MTVKRAVSQARRGRVRGRRPGGAPVPLIAGAIAAAIALFILFAWQSGRQTGVATTRAGSGLSGAPAAAAPAGQPAAVARTSAPAEPRGLAPDFTVATIDGGSFTLSEQRGRPTVLFFTASYCEPCKAQMRTLARIQEEQGADKIGVLVVGVDPSEQPEDLRRLSRELGSPAYPFALDSGSRLTLAYGVRALDTKVFVGKDGVLVERVDGIPQSEGQLRDMVAKLIGVRV